MGNGRLGARKKIKKCLSFPILCLATLECINAILALLKLCQQSKTPVLILTPSDITPTRLSLPWGTEEGISYRGLAFLPTRSFASQEDAIAACRRDLEIGVLSIVVRSPQGLTLWSPVPDLVPAA